MNSSSPHRARIIIDTDIGSDCDDAGALATLHALADSGEAEILACIYSSGRNPYGPGCISAINTYYGRPGIPIGAAAESELGDPRNDFLQPIATNQKLYRHPVMSRQEVPKLVSVYRSALVNAPDRSVQLVSIGHTQGLYDLLQSPPDATSPLPGRDLVQRKVQSWVAMAGQFPNESEPGWNFGKNGAARYSRSVVQNWPTPIVFSGYEIGAAIPTGRALRATPIDNPVREAYRLWDQALEQGRASWDQTAVLYAVRGAADYWELRRGRCDVDDAGRTHWQDDSQGPHAYLVQRMPPADVANVIEQLMCRVPANTTSSNQ
jgi:inosine-uridine nucleoside N-ribohydrolase